MRSAILLYLCIGSSVLLTPSTILLAQSTIPPSQAIAPAAALSRTANKTVEAENTVPVRAIQTRPAAKASVARKPSSPVRKAAEAIAVVPTIPPVQAFDAKN